MVPLVPISFPMIYKKATCLGISILLTWTVSAAVEEESSFFSVLTLLAVRGRASDDNDKDASADEALFKLGRPATDIVIDEHSSSSLPKLLSAVMEGSFEGDVEFEAERDAEGKAEFDTDTKSSLV